MTKRASGRELDPNLIPIVAELTPAQIRRAGVNTVDYCLRNGLGRDDMTDLLGALGLVPTASPASTDPNGMTVYKKSPESRRKAADRKAAYERRNREAS